MRTWRRPRFPRDPRRTTRCWADEALSLGLVNRVVPDEDLGAVTMELARSLAHGPSIALSLMKRNMNCAESSVLAELLDMEATHQGPRTSVSSLRRRGRR